MVHDIREGMHGLCRIEGVHSSILDAVHVQPLSAVLVALKQSNNCQCHCSSCGIDHDLTSKLLASLQNSNDMGTITWDLQQLDLQSNYGQHLQLWTC